MPEESINIFISNIYAAAIFTGIFFLMFLFISGLSKIFIFRATKNRARDLPGISKTLKPQIFSSYRLNKDTNTLKTLIVLGTIFVYTIFFVLMVLLTMHFATSFKIGTGLYLIFAMAFLMIVLTVCIVKAGIMD